MEIKETNDYLFEVSNIRGKNVKVPYKLNFSFYFSSKDAVEGKDLVHGLRVKPIFNPEKMSVSNAGTLKLHSDWEYIPGKDDIGVKSKYINEMKDFFATYKILFAAVWEKAISPDVIYDYFRGVISFKELMEEFDFYNTYKDEMSNITTTNELNDFVEKHNLFNTWNI